MYVFHIGHYNIVGVASSMEIFSMHEKSTIDLHNAQEFEISS